MYFSEQFIYERYFYVPGASFARFEINKVINHSMFAKCRRIKDKKKKYECKIQIIDECINKLKKSKSLCTGRKNENSCLNKIQSRIESLQNRKDKYKSKFTVKSLKRYNMNIF